MIRLISIIFTTMDKTTSPLLNLKQLKRIQQEGGYLLPDCFSPTFDGESRGRSFLRIIYHERTPSRVQDVPSAMPAQSRVSWSQIAGIFGSDCATSSWQHDFCSAAAEPEFAERRGKQHGAQWGRRGEFKTSEIFSTFRSFWPFIIFRRSDEGTISNDAERSRRWWR